MRRGGAMASLLDRLVVGFLPLVPKPLVGYFSRPYIAGVRADDAFREVRHLREQGACATLDILGEHIHSLEEADAAQAGYLDLLESIHREQVRSGVSVKLTQLGLKLDLEGCYSRIDALVKRAEEFGIFVRLDMEDSSCTDDTLELYKRLSQNHQRVGVVIQSMLRRSLADVERLAAVSANVRLCKGIYVEPHHIAYQDREIIRRSFVELLDMLLAAGSYVGIATHDEQLVFEALNLVRRYRLSREQYEFQMLLGVAEPLRRVLIDAGHRLRVYVPFGQQWYAYSVRRLKENPQLAGTVARAVLKRH
jgi:proline dehydrogenase